MGVVLIGRFAIDVGWLSKLSAPFVAYQMNLKHGHTLFAWTRRNVLVQ